MSTKVQNHATECNIRVKSGDLAAQGKGTMAILPLTGNQVSVKVLLPTETGVPEPLDLTAVERVELVAKKNGWFSKNQWGTPLFTTVGAFIGVPVVIFALVEVTEATALLIGGTWLGATYASGVYTGSKLTRLARFVVTTKDGKHAVLEAPEPVFGFLNGVYTAPNIQLDDATVPETSAAPAADPAPAAA